MSGRRNTVAVDYSNEMMVQDVSIPFLYQRHSILAYIAFVAVVTYAALFRDSSQYSDVDNIKLGIIVSCIVICIIGMLVFPSGPFVRPHPVFWRLVFAMSMLYLTGLILILFMSLDQARFFMTYIDSRLNKQLPEKSYGENCEFTVDNLLGAMDRFVIAHFLGWVVQSMLIRHRLACWTVSIMWELIEISLKHQLPNFAECWWDQWILDVMLCNGIGIEVGYQLCNYLEVQEYKWSNLFTIPTFSGKAKRVVAQFTSPESWTKVRWETTTSIKRFFAMQVILIAMMVTHLNAFYLKYLLWVPAENDLNVIRLFILTVIMCPTIRQVYLYVDRPDVSRLGAQAW
jgi:hypothetical protein